MHKIICGLLLALGLIGCKSKRTATNPNNPAVSNESVALPNTNWIVVQATPAATNQPFVYTKELRLSFGADKTQIQLDVNGCHLATSYPAADSVLLSGAAVCTKKCCDAKEAKELLQILPATWHARKEGNNLRLSNRDFVLLCKPAS